MPNKLVAATAMKTPRSVAPRTAPTRAPAPSAANDVVADELTDKLTRLEQKLRKELLGLGEPMPQPQSQRSSTGAPTARGPYSVQRGGSAPIRGGTPTAASRV